MFTTAHTQPLTPTPQSTTTVGQRVRAVARRAADDIRARVGIAALFLLGATTAIFANGDNACHCAITATDAPLVEWDMPIALDAGAGAITVDVHPSSHSQRIWFVSRIGDPPRLFRFEVGKHMATDSGKWKSFELSRTGQITGGLHRIKVHSNDRWIFVRTNGTLQRIDTGDCTSLMLMETCKRVTWMDQVGSNVIQASDVAIDDCNVYTTAEGLDDTGQQTAGAAYVQQLSHCGNVNPPSGTTTVKRWLVGGGAGFCTTDPPAPPSEGSPCLSGVAIEQRYHKLVYFSEPDANVIGELNVTNNNVRRWSLAALGQGVSQPRQLEIDDDGLVWAVTGSGHLVRLDPKKNRMSAHMMPAAVSADPFGVAPDHGAIGYTNSNSDPAPYETGGGNRIGMLLPNSSMQTVYPTTECVTPALAKVDYLVEDSAAVVGSSPAQPKMAIAHVTSKPDGVYVEAQVGAGDSGGNGSWNPLGVTPDWGRRVGSYFYAVGQNMDNGMVRIGHIQLPFARKDHRFARDDDDHDGQHHGNGDDDDDGVKDGDDHDDHHESRDRHDNETVESGQSVDYPMEADANTTSLTTTAVASDLGQMMAVEVYNPAGQLVAAPLPAPGTAVVTIVPLTVGTYTVRVKNLGITPTAFTTTTVASALWPLLP